MDIVHNVLDFSACYIIQSLQATWKYFYVFHCQCSWWYCIICITTPWTVNTAPLIIGVTKNSNYAWFVRKSNFWLCHRIYYAIIICNFIKLAITLLWMNILFCSKWFLKGIWHKISYWINEYWNLIIIILWPTQ